MTGGDQRAAARVTVMHFEDVSDTSGYFPQLAKWHDRARYRMLFGTLQPMDPKLETYMAGQGVDRFSCECRGRLEYGFGLLRLQRYLRRQRVDILHTHLFEPSVVGLTAAAWAGTPFRVMTRHYSDYHTRIGKRWHLRLDRLCTRLADAVVAVSQHTADHMISEEHAPPGKIHVVLNGIDFDRVRVSGPAASERIRRDVDAAQAHLLVVLARLHPEKGYGTLFRTLPGLRRRLARPTVLIVAGTGPFEAQYRAEVAALGCDDMVRFVGFRQDAADLIAAADLVVLPSLAEAFGLVLAESLALGTPVVATRVGGIPEIVDDGVDGVLVPPEDAPALEDALVALLGDPQRRRRLSGAGVARMRERFGFLEMVRAYERIYDGLVAGRRA
jgi:glycosyltransferase involved in cell wall biosynthesis